MGRPARPAQKRKQAAKPAPSTWDGVGAALGIDIRRLYRLRLEPGAPATPSIEQWRVFVAARETTGAGAPKARTPAELDREQADLRYAKARAEREERENAISAGLVVTRVQAVAAAAAVRDAFIAEGEGLAGVVLTLLPKLAKSDRDAVENAVRAAWATTCTRIAAGMRS